MIDHAQMRNIFASRGIRRAVYFHTDHFEPWVSRPNTATNLAMLDRFYEECEKSWFARRLTLFYCPKIDRKYPLTSSDTGYTRANDDPIGFKRFPSHDISDSLRRWSSQTQHEYQIHLHHEGMTRGTKKYGLPWDEWMEQSSTSAKDAERFVALLTVTRQAAAADVGLSLDRPWFFVHGKWALNASDHEVCTIENEIELLMKNGCVGDFTFPAGRTHCSPSIKSPYTCLPVAGSKAYDTPAAMPVEVASSWSAMKPFRFLIWSADLPHNHCSLDYWSKPVLAAIEDAPKLVYDWVNHAPVINGTLYVKTHAHSVDPKMDGLAHSPFGHLSVIKLFDHFAEVCTAVGCKIECETVSEIYQSFVGEATTRARASDAQRTTA